MIITENLQYLESSIWSQQLEMLKLLRKFEVTKTAGTVQILGNFLKDGVQILAKPINEPCNLSMALKGFSGTCKIARLEPLLKKDSKTDPTSYRPISLKALLL